MIYHDEYAALRAGEEAPRCTICDGFVYTAQKHTKPVCEPCAKQIVERNQLDLAKFLFATFQPKPFDWAKPSEPSQLM